MHSLVLWMFLTPLGSSIASERYALLVGVNECPNYELPEGGKPRPLRGAENDARALAEMLQEKFGFDESNVQLLIGEAATCRAITTSLEQLAAKVTEDDVLVFHFSGHGTQFEDRRPFDEADGLDEALCPHDALANGENLLTDDALGLLLTEIPARRITVLLDCCHAGTGIKDAETEFTPRYLPPIKTAESVESANEQPPWREVRSAAKGFGSELTAIYACRADQQAYERRMLTTRPPRHMGQFTHYLLAGLKDNTADDNQDGKISHAELLEFVTRQLDDKYNRLRRNPSEQQRPAADVPRPEEAIFGTTP
ncbi:MAG: caspase family protein [Pirellulaceae bacterium]